MSPDVSEVLLSVILYRLFADDDVLRLSKISAVLIAEEHIVLRAGIPIRANRIIAIGKAEQPRCRKSTGAGRWIIRRDVRKAIYHALNERAVGGISHERIRGALIGQKY